MPDETRRTRIVEAAMRALDEQEYAHIQMRDVATSAGIALGTLYRHFSSKEHLYATVLLEWAALGRSQAGAGGQGDAGPGADRLRSRIHGVITAYERQPQFYRVQVLLRTSPDRNARAVLAEFTEIARAVLAADLAEAVPAGVVDATDAATMLWSLVTSRLTDAVYGDGRMSDAHRLADRFVDLLAGVHER
jgi:AcrR family transcriptional regulator